MGCSFSSVLTAVDDDGYSHIPSTAMVVETDGSLLEYSGGIRASEVIIAAGQFYALCNSDKLFFDAYPPATAPDEELEPGQIYFLLPLSELNQRLSGPNVAALAIRASAALKRAAEKQGRRTRIRVAPMGEVFDAEDVNSSGNFELRLAAKTTETKMMKKKYKGMTGVGSEGLRSLLSTIEEVDED